MRRSLARALVALLPAALLLPFGGTASATGGCAAYGTVPHLVPRESDLHASGTFTCLEQVPGMSVVVCIEERFRNHETGADEWLPIGCGANSEESVRTVTAAAVAPVMVYSTLLRTTVTGTNQNGDEVTFTTPPILFFNCACYIG